MNVKDAISKLSKLPQEKELVCQVIANNGSVWTCLFDFLDVQDSDWACQLRVFHPDLENLPDDPVTQSDEELHKDKDLM